MNNLRAFHNDSKIKTKYIKRVQAHMKADELVRGSTGEDGKGCAVWCTMNDYRHDKYETELGIPEWLAKVEDRLFEGMSFSKSKTWPEKFLKSISVGASLEKIKVPFLIVILKHSIKTLDNIKIKDTDVKLVLLKSKTAVGLMIEALKSEDKLLIKKAKKAASYAANAASDAAHAAYDYFADELIKLLSSAK